MTNKTIVMSCWSKGMRNSTPEKFLEQPKNYPYWQKLINMLKAEKWEIWQVGQGAEKRLENVDKYIFDKPFWQLKEDVKAATIWMSVDNFFPHLCHHFGIPGIVLFGPSDPDLFGYPENNNVLKDRKYLRPKQFEFWESWTHDPNAWLSEHAVLKIIHDEYKRRQQNEQQNETGSRT